MHRYFLLTLAISCCCGVLAQENPLDTDRWKAFFAERSYEKNALSLNDDTFWTVSDSYTYDADYPLLIIYADKTSEEIIVKYEGLHSLIYKKTPLIGSDSEHLGKENIAYMVFDGLLLKNPLIGNMIAGDFMIVCKKGPLSLYREFFTSPIERNNIESALSPYYMGEPVTSFHLGSFSKKTSKLLKDCEELAGKIDDGLPGYSDVDVDFLRIAEEYNAWVKENYPYRYADHLAMFWQYPEY